MKVKSSKLFVSISNPFWIESSYRSIKVTLMVFKFHNETNELISKEGGGGKKSGGKKSGEKKVEERKVEGRKVELKKVEEKRKPVQKI